MKPSTLRVLRALEAGAKTKKQIFRETGIDSVAQRIDELRDAGCVIDTTLITVTNRYKEKVRVARWRLLAVPRSIARTVKINSQVKKVAA